MSIFKVNEISYSYDNKKDVIKNLSYEFDKGNVYGIIGKSGAGKTTFLSLLAGLTRPKSGNILYNEMDISKIDQYKYRSQYVGVIFQSYNLMPNLTAEENVILSMDISGKKFKNKKEKARELLKSVGLNQEYFDRRVLKLSGGEQQRVAIARTLACESDVILADEPTGNLDGETQDNIMNIFMTLAKNEDKCVILVTHSPEVTKKVDVVYNLSVAN